MSPRADLTLREYTVRVLIPFGVAALFIGLITLLYTGSGVLALAFVGILVAVLLRTVAERLASWLHLSPNWTLALLLTAATAALVLGNWYLASSAMRQWDDFLQTIEASWKHAVGELNRHAWGRKLFEFSRDSTFTGDGIVISKLGWFLSSGLGAAVDLFVIVFIGVYLAADPETYRRGMLHLIPPRSRGRGDEVICALAHTLRRWLVGRIVNMAIIGVLTAIGLSLLGMPVVAALSFLAFLCDFVPYVGPIIAAVPALLIAFTQADGITTALYVALLYFGVQMVESYLVQPLIQSRAVQMPPALLLTSQLLLGAMLGVPGIIIATPLTVVVMVLVKELYVGDALGDAGIGRATD